MPGATQELAEQRLRELHAALINAFMCGAINLLDTSELNMGAINDFMMEVQRHVKKGQQ